MEEHIKAFKAQSDRDVKTVKEFQLYQHDDGQGQGMEGGTLRRSCTTGERKRRQDTRPSGIVPRVGGCAGNAAPTVSATKEGWYVWAKRTASGKEVFGRRCVCLMPRRGGRRRTHTSRCCCAPSASATPPPVPGALGAKRRARIPRMRRVSTRLTRPG